MTELDELKAKLARAEAELADHRNLAKSWKIAADYIGAWVKSRPSTIHTRSETMMKQLLRCSEAIEQIIAKHQEARNAE